MSATQVVILRSDTKNYRRIERDEATKNLFIADCEILRYAKNAPLRMTWREKIALWNGIVKIFLSIKFHADHSNRELIESILTALANCGHSTTCIVRDVERWGEIQFDATELMRRTFAEVDASDLVIVDLTEKGVGVGIEAGYAHAKQIPIVTIARRGADVSTTLQGISRTVFYYDDRIDLERLFSQL